jgi:hypothetical protein
MRKHTKVLKRKNNFIPIYAKAKIIETENLFQTYLIIGATYLLDTKQ